MKRVLEQFNISSNHDALTLAKVGEWQYDVRTDETFLSDNLYEIFELEKLDSENRSPVPYFSLVHPDDLTQFKELVEDAITANKPYHSQHRIRLNNGNVKWVLVVGHPVLDSDGNVAFLRGILQDITQYKLDHDRLQNMESLFKSLAANIPGMIFQFRMKPDGKMNFPYISAGASRVYETDPQKFIENPESIFETVHPDDRVTLMEKTQESAKNLSTFHWELRLLFPDNRIKWVQAASTPRLEPDGSIIWDGMMIDITEKKAAQEVIETQKAKMVSSAKLAALGEMAAGVAHEINNPLTIIHTRAFQIKSLIESGRASPEALSQLADKIMETVDRAAKIVRSLRHFARDSEKDPEQVISLQNLLNDTLELCRERFKNHNVRLEIVEIPSTLALRCRSVQVSQVLLNLVSNALDAVIAQKSSKQQWVRIDVIENPEGIDFTVTDSGDGIPGSIREKIFMPFFTTKEPGKGTGLGLSLSHGIMKEHGGKLYLNSESTPTQFIARFPKHRFNKFSSENN